MDFIGACLFLFVPLNVISWLLLGRFGGISIFVLSCFSILFIALRQGIFYYNGYIVLYGAAAFIGYRIFLKLMLERNRYLAMIEAAEVEKNTLTLELRKKEAQIEAAKARVKRYVALKDMVESLSSTLNMDEIGRLVIDKAFDIIGRTDVAFLFLIDEVRQELRPFSSKVSYLGPGEILQRRRDIFDKWILKQRMSLLVEDLDNDFRFSADALGDSRDKVFKSIIAAPLMSEQKIIGVLHMESMRKGAYTQDDLRLLNIISGLAAVSIGNSMLYQKTNELAITDSLTGLYVQRYFKERLDVEIKKARDDVSVFSVLMIDLDYFKERNDRYGHGAGDILLRKVAQVLKSAVGSNSLISRYGGEEFAILLFEIDKEKALDIAEDIRKRVEDLVFTLRRDEVRITISVGVSSFPSDADTAAAILKKADENLYKAKEAGRNRVWPTRVQRQRF